MKISYFSQLQMPKPWDDNAELMLYQNAMDQAVYAESVGFETYWQTEHHFFPEIGHSSSPELFLAALAMKTSTIRLGLAVVVLPVNHPYRVVEYVSTLDILSNGRVEFGTGRGSSGYHVEAFGLTSDTSKEVWEESLKVIKSMFLDHPFPGWNGTHYKNLAKRDIVPKPIQRPHPPMWVAASQNSTFEMAGKLGIGAMGFSPANPDELRTSVNSYRNARSESSDVVGPINNRIAAFAICNVDKSYHVGRDLACDAARWFFGNNKAAVQKVRYGNHHGKYHEDVPDVTLTQMEENILRRSNDELIREGIVLGGDIDTLCRGIEGRLKAGIDELLLMVQAGNTTHDETMRALDLIGNQVIPKFRERSS